MTSAPSPGTNAFQNLIESICRANDQGQKVQTEDLRQIFTQIGVNLQAALPGGRLVAANGVKANRAGVPSGVALAVAGANGAFSLSMSNTSGTQGIPVWYEVSYSPLRSFSGSVVTLPQTTAPSQTLNLPGQSYFFRVRASFDQVNWSSYVAGSTAPVASGLVSSSATSNAGAFNQTNFGVVSSEADGASFAVTVAGASGPYSAVPVAKGPALTSLPSATILGVQPGSEHFVGWNGSAYVLSNTLAGLLADDNVTPIGKVSVVATGVPVLPAVTPVVVNGYVVGATWTGDSGLTAPPTLTVTDPGGGGAGAVMLCTGVTAGKMDGIQVLNPGKGYDGSTAVTATGGVSGGTAGGGTATGGNGGRLTAV